LRPSGGLPTGRANFFDTSFTVITSLSYGLTTSIEPPTRDGSQMVLVAHDDKVIIKA
jgi:hypothetical protein